MNAAENSELTTLFNEYANGEISPERLSYLEYLLTENPEARQSYIRFFRVHASLYDTIEHSAPQQARGTRIAAVEKSCKTTSTYSTYEIPQFALFAAVSAIVLFLIVLPLWGIWLESDKASQNLASAPQNVERQSIRSGPAVDRNEPYATVSQMVGVEMASNQSELYVGQGIWSQQFSIKSGLLQIDFLSGVRMILEGDVELNLVSQNQCELLRGTARVYAPQQEKRFVLVTQTATIIDQVSEFGIRVSPSGAAEVHVFDGELEVLARNGNRKTNKLVAGTALAFSETNEVSHKEARSNDFPSMSLFRKRAAQFAKQRHNQWRTNRSKLLSDEELLVYYDFESDVNNSQIVVDRTENNFNGVVVGCNRAEGRWPGTRAIEFKHIHDRVRINIPGFFNSLSLCTWIRLDGFDRRFNSIMLTDNFEEGHVHWQVRSDGILDMGIKPKGEERILFLSKSILGFQDLGRWVHLVAVVDRKHAVVLHYLDGEQVSRIPIETGVEDDHAVVPFDYPLQIGRAELGNWRQEFAGEQNEIRNLNGRIDEFSIYSKALSQTDVRQLYEFGHP